MRLTPRVAQALPAKPSPSPAPIPPAAPTADWLPLWLLLAEHRRKPQTCAVKFERDPKPLKDRQVIRLQPRTGCSWPQGARNLIKMEVGLLRQVWPVVEGGCAQLLEKEWARRPEVSRVPAPGQDTATAQLPPGQRQSPGATPLPQTVSFLHGSIMALSHPSCLVIAYGRIDKGRRKK